MPGKGITHFTQDELGISDIMVAFCLDVINGIIFPGSESERL